MVKQQTACNISNILLSTLEFLSFKHLVSETKELNLKVHDAFGSYITYSPIIHHSSNLIPLPSANYPETSTETTKFSTFLEMATATLGLFCSRSLPVLKETKVNYIFYSPRYQPLTELFGEQVFNVFQGCGEDDQDPDLYKQFPCCGWQGLLLLQHAELMRLPRQGFIVPGELGYLISLVSAGRH